jgi:hypothetical protein
MRAMMRGAVVAAVTVVVLVLLLIFVFLVMTADQVCSNGTTDSSECSMANFVPQQSTASSSQDGFAKSALALWSVWAWHITWSSTISLRVRCSVSSLLWWVGRVSTIVIIPTLRWWVLLVVLLYLAVCARLLVFVRRWCIVALLLGRVRRVTAILLVVRWGLSVSTVLRLLVVVIVAALGSAIWSLLVWRWRVTSGSAVVVVVGHVCLLSVGIIR